VRQSGSAARRQLQLWDCGNQFFSRLIPLANRRKLKIARIQSPNSPPFGADPVAAISDEPTYVHMLRLQGHVPHPNFGPHELATTQGKESSPAPPAYHPEILSKHWKLFTYNPINQHLFRAERFPPAQHANR